MIVTLDLNIVLVLGVVVLAFYLFVKEVFPVDVTALFIMAILMLTKLVTPEEAISGFSNHAVITILSMFVLSTGIEKTGIIHALSLRIFGLVGSKSYLQLIMVMLLVAPFSGFLNNAAIVAILLPFVMNLTKMSKTSPSKLLIPLSYVSMSAGMLTLIGTSTNLLANSVLPRFGLASFNMFDFWDIGLIVLGITILYFMIIGYWLLPKNHKQSLDSPYENLNYTFEVKLNKNSKLIGKKIKDSILRKKYKVKILKLRRANQTWDSQFSNRMLKEGDIITIDAPRDVLLNLESESGVDISLEELHKEAASIETMQMIVPHDSRYIGKKIKDLNLNKKYKAIVMAVRKGQKRITERIDEVKLQIGDMLLLKTTSDFVDDLKSNPNLMVMEQLEASYRKDKTLTAVLIMFGVVGFAALGVYPILVTSLIGVILMLLTGVITTDETYHAIRWEVIFLLAGLIPLGIALEKSGTASFIASIISKLTSGLPILYVLIGFYIFTTLMTEVLSNNASVILLVPIGIDLAARLNMNPYLFVLVIMFAASTSFLTPVGYKTNTMVYGTGVYKFSDFFKVGVWLNMILAVITPYLILKLWGG